MHKKEEWLLMLAAQSLFTTNVKSVIFTSRLLEHDLEHRLMAAEASPPDQSLMNPLDGWKKNRVALHCAHHNLLLHKFILHKN